MPKIDIKKTESPAAVFYTATDSKVVVTEIARLRELSPAGRQFLARSGHYCQMVRTIMARRLRGAVVDKKVLMTDFGFAGRLVNTATKEADAQIESAKECAVLEWEVVQTKLARALVDYGEAAADPKSQGELPGRERRMARLVKQETQAQRRQLQPSIFPGRKAYQNQSRPGWKRDYAERRSDHIGCIGSSDETAGNSTLQVKLGPAETLAAGKLWQWFGLEHAGEVLGRFRLPAAECVELVHVVQQNAGTRRKQGVEIWLDRQGKKIQPKQVNAMQARGEAPAATKTVPRVITAGRVPLSVTLRRREDGKWYLFASFPRNDLPGAIAQPAAWMGVDLNADSVAHAVMQMVAGEPVLLSYRKDTFSLNDSKAHRTERLYRIVNALVADAKQNGWGVSLEYLDFEHCKSWLKTKLGALLHFFPYRKIRRIFERRCLEAGVPLRYVKPEYSSLLGAVLCVRWPALGRDQAAGAVPCAAGERRGQPVAGADLRAHGARLTCFLAVKREGKIRTHPRNLRGHGCCAPVGQRLRALRSVSGPPVAARLWAPNQGRSLDLVGLICRLVARARPGRRAPEAPSAGLQNAAHSLR